MTQQEIEAAFLLSGVRLYAAQPIVNSYPGMQKFRGPRWACSTELGEIVVGWRKRVIEIDWSAIGSIVAPLRDTETGYTRWLAEDDTDQGATYIHAWGLANVPRYLALLGRAAPTLIAKEPQP